MADEDKKDGLVNYFRARIKHMFFFLKKKDRLK